MTILSVVRLSVVRLFAALPPAAQEGARSASTGSIRAARSDG